jgi:magnesium chelatase subunit I
MSTPQTLGELKAMGRRPLRVKDEIRQNLIKKLREHEEKDLFVHKDRKGNVVKSITGYDDTVIPQIFNALLARHNFILLGLRGQAKSRILRELTGLLDEFLPIIAGSEVNDDPFNPISAYGKQTLAEKGDQTPISWIDRNSRYVEKLATPDVTIADLIGDVDPIKAAREGRLLSDQLTIHYGLLPRANRGIFAINELPDLAGKIQVGLFNIMQEGDVQIKGYPVRLPLDVLLVFTANPEDYTARGKIITPLKDRIGAEIHTHYPDTIELGAKITNEEAWIKRYTDAYESKWQKAQILLAIREVIEQIAFIAREDKRVDKRSGVSQRLPITLMELAFSNAERRSLTTGDYWITPRISDIYAAIPAITGKLELEYEGEQIGADRVARDLIRKACGEVFSSRYAGIDFRPVIDHFNIGNTLTLSDMIPDKEALEEFQRVNGLVEAARSKIKEETEGAIVSACELMLEGLYAQKKLARTEERGVASYSRVAPERPSRKQNFDDWTGGRLN